MWKNIFLKMNFPVAMEIEGFVCVSETHFSFPLAFKIKFVLFSL